MAFVEFGQVPSLYLGACAALNATGCSAYALSTTVLNNGTRLVEDLSGQVRRPGTQSC